MQKVLYNFFLGILLFLVVSLVGCIDIVEQITVNKDGSGNFKTYVDMGMLGNFAMGMASDKLDNSQINQIKSLTTFAEQKLKNVKGVSNIKSDNNIKAGKLFVGFDFDNYKTLNEVFFMLAEKNKEFYYPNLYKINKHRLVKLNFAPALRFLINKYKKDLKEEQYLKILNYKTVYILPAKIKKCSNPLFKISEDEKTLVFYCTMEELLNTNLNTGVKIKF